VDRNNRYIN